MDEAGPEKRHHEKRRWLAARRRRHAGAPTTMALEGNSQHAINGEAIQFVPAILLCKLKSL